VWGRGGWGIAVACLALAGCGGGAGQAGIPSTLLSQARPIGVGARFHPPGRGVVVGDCRRGLGRRFGVHVEVFASDRVVLIPAGLGARPPRSLTAGRLVAARCYGALVTLDPTGVVLVRYGERHTVGELFREWGQPLSTRVVASFHVSAGHRVVAFVDGRRWRGSVARIPLGFHSEIVIEVGPFVPPHQTYVFPSGS
jgi:hypothetical protein